MSRSYQKRTEIIKIEIKNWAKYQTRKDLKTMRFFRVENSIFDDAKFASLTTTGKVMWLRLLCECSRGISRVSVEEVRGKCEVNVNQTARMLRVSPHHIRSAILQLEELQMVKVSNRNESVPRIEKNRIEKNRISKKSFFGFTNVTLKEKEFTKLIDTYGESNVKKLYLNSPPPEHGQPD